MTSTNHRKRFCAALTFVGLAAVAGCGPTIAARRWWCDVGGIAPFCSQTYQECEGSRIGRVRSFHTPILRCEMRVHPWCSPTHNTEDLLTQFAREQHLTPRERDEFARTLPFESGYCAATQDACEEFRRAAWRNNHEVLAPCQPLD